MAIQSADPASGLDAYYAAIERRVGLAHEYLTGMIIGSGLVAAIGAVLAAAGGVVGFVLGAVVAAVLLLRARSYANANQAIALLVNGIVAVGGLMAGLLATARQPGVLLAGFAGLLVLATLALVTGVAVPRHRFSPVLRRSVEPVKVTTPSATKTRMSDGPIVGTRRTTWSTTSLRISGSGRR